MESTERMSGVSKPRAGVRVVSIALSVVFGLLLAVLFARSAQIATSWPPTFDGAMNMEVARSIAEGEGYRRNYAEREAFPHEIQTGVPYVLPSALVFKLWHVGFTQAEIVNIAYLALLLTMVYLLVAPLGGRALALFAACTVIVVPGTHTYGFFGYGEIPALAWALAATVVYFGKTGRHRLLSGFAAGVLLALAVYTKTVMLIGAGSLCFVAGLEWLATREGRHERSRRLAAFVAGGLMSILAMETWRAVAVGGFRAWGHWWHEETRNVFMQAGVKPGFGNFSHSLAEKLHTHFTLLGQDYRMSQVLTGLWLALLLVAGGVTLLRFKGRSGKWTTLTVLLLAIVYMLWWLLLTPTAKAWLRRILDGMICADIGIIMCVALWFDEWRARVTAKPLVRTALMVLTALFLALPAMWLVKGAHGLLRPEVSPKTCGWYMADGGACARYNPAAGPEALLRMAQQVKELSANAYVFGLGWYSAPRVGLFSGRYMADFNDMPVDRLQPGRPVYFVQGPDTPLSHLARIRALYGVTRTPDSSYALIEAHSMMPAPLLPGGAKVLRYIQAAQHYAYLRGFNRSEGANGRWLTDDNQVLLRPEPGDRFELVAYVLPVAKYEYPEAPQVRVSFDGCAAPAQVTTPNTLNHMLFAIPDGCAIPPYKPVSVRIEVDNLVESAISHDQRALGVLAKSFGFVAAGNGDDAR